MRVYLRSLEYSDVTDEYLSWFADDDVTAFLEVNGKSLNIDLVRDYIRHGIDTGSYYMHAICLKENDRHIGNLKVGPIIKKHGVADLPCVIGDKTQWGKGLATEAISLGNTLAFETYGIRKLSGQIYADNLGSIKAYCKAGWIIEGVNEARYIVDNKPMDQVIVSCFNPKDHSQEQTSYSIDRTREFIQLREQFLKR